MNWKTPNGGICCLILALSGCAPTASFTRWKPARVDTPVRRLVLLDITGPESVRGDAQRVLATGLARSGAFDLASEQDLRPVAPERLRFENGSVNMPAVLEATRRLGAEAILVSRLRIIETNGASVGSVTMRLGDPEVLAAIQYRLINARTGLVIEQDTVRSAPYEGELTRSATGPTSRANIFGRLAKESASMVAGSLAPHEVQVEVALANPIWGTGAATVRAGNAAAKQGNWREAMKQWNDATREDPEDDAAWYSLGLAHEALGEFRQASGAYQRAGELKQDKLYQSAIARVNVASHDSEVATAQRLRPPRQFAAAPRQFAAAPRQFAAAPPQFNAVPPQFNVAPPQNNAAPQQFNAPRQQHHATPPPPGQRPVRPALASAPRRPIGGEYNPPAPAYPSHPAPQAPQAQVPQAHVPPQY